MNEKMINQIARNIVKKNVKPVCLTIRKTWGELNPTEKVIKNKKKYDRKKVVDNE